MTGSDLKLACDAESAEEELLKHKWLKKVKSTYVKMECISTGCIWGCVAIDQSEHADGAQNGGHGYQCGTWSNGRRRCGLMNHTFFTFGCPEHACHLPGEEMTSGCTTGEGLSWQRQREALVNP